MRGPMRACPLAECIHMGMEDLHVLLCYRFDDSPAFPCEEWIENVVFPLSFFFFFLLLVLHLLHIR